MRPEKHGTMLFDMSKQMIESFAGAANMMVRVFAILAALSAVLYLLSSWKLQKANKHESEKRLEAEHRHAELEAEISQAHGRIEELKSANVQLEAQVAEEHEARLLVQRRFGPRIVSPAAASGIIAALHPFAGQKVNFAYFAELETAEFAQGLADTLKAAGWKAQIYKLKSIQPAYGVSCGGPNPDDPALRALADALRLVDKRLDTQTSPAALTGAAPQWTDQLWIMVALKRPHLRPAPHTGDSPQAIGTGGAAEHQ
jgi:hypothetical protein